MFLLPFFVAMVQAVAFNPTPVELTAFAPSITPRAATAELALTTVPSQWVPVPTSLPMPCFLQVPDNCPTTYYYDCDYEDDRFRIPYFECLGFVGPMTGSEISCGLIWSSSLFEWMKTAPTTHLPLHLTTKTMFETTETLVPTSFWVSTTATTLISTWQGFPISWEYTQEYTTKTSSSTVTTTVEATTITSSSQPTKPYFKSAFPFTASAPCCGSCRVYGSTVQVFQWPTPAPSPPVSTLVDEKNNFTFISPTIYVAFDSLYAKDLCQTLGTVVYTTIGFSSEELLTSQIYTSTTTDLQYGNPYLPTGFTQGTWGQFPECTNITSVFYQPLGIRDIITDSTALQQYTQTMDGLYFVSGTAYDMKSYPGGVIRAYTITSNPCSPMLSVPTKLLNINEIWTSCVPGIEAFFDPTITLRTGGVMNLSPVHNPAEKTASSESSTAVAGLAPVLASPTKTSTSTPKQTGTSKPSEETPAPPKSTLTTYGSNPTTAAPIPSAYLIGSQTLAPGKAPITYSGNEISLRLDGDIIVLDHTKTIAVAEFLGSLDVDADVRYVFGTQTLSAGGPAITVGGARMSLVPGGRSVVVETESENVGAKGGVSSADSGDTNARGEVAESRKSGVVGSSSGPSTKWGVSSQQGTKSGDVLQETVSRAFGANSPYTRSGGESRGRGAKRLLCVLVGFWVAEFAVYRVYFE